MFNNFLSKIVPFIE